jgi:hypothetical protein
MVPLVLAREEICGRGFWTGFAQTFAPKATPSRKGAISGRLRNSLFQQRNRLRGRFGTSYAMTPFSAGPSSPFAGLRSGSSPLIR